MKRYRVFRIIGAVVIILSVAGFFTVADDLRHQGELSGTLSFLMAGICLFFSGYRFKITDRLSLQWLALGFAAAIPVGAWSDHMLFSVAFCAGLGQVAAFLCRDESPLRPGNETHPPDS